jgi:hypothetical protein
MGTVTNSLIQKIGRVTNSRFKIMGTVTNRLIQNIGNSNQQPEPK